MQSRAVGRGHGPGLGHRSAVPVLLGGCMFISCKRAYQACAQPLSRIDLEMLGGTEARLPCTPCCWAGAVSSVLPTGFGASGASTKGGSAWSWWRGCCPSACGTRCWRVPAGIVPWKQGWRRARAGWQRQAGMSCQAAGSRWQCRPARTAGREAGRQGCR